MKSEDIWKQDMPKQLARTLTRVSVVSDMQNLLRDLMTEKEIVEISARLEAARMLKNGEKYVDIISVTKLSSRTIARISEWLKNGEDGYKKAIDAIQAHNPHISPGRD